MSQEKKLVLFFAIIFLWMMVATQISNFMGWTPPRKPAAAAAKDAKAKPDAAADAKIAKAGPKVGADVAKADPAAKAKALARAEAGPAAPKPPKEPEIKWVDGSELVLGSTKDRAPGAYRIRIQLQQQGAAVERVESARYDGEFEIGKPRKRPLEFISPSRNPDAPPSLALTLGQGVTFAKALAAGDADDADKAAAREAAADAVEPLDSAQWEVVIENGKAVRTVTGRDRETNKPVTGEAVVFRITAKSGVVVTKTYRLFPGTDGFELEMKFESPDKERSTVYHLLGPHGIPIEGLWYTGTFRDVFFGQLGQDKPTTLSASDVASAKDGSSDNTEKPIRYAGIENQYFATFVEPDPPPTGQDDRWDSRTAAIMLYKDERVIQSEVGVEITSRPITLKPAEPVVHLYRVFTGPKTDQALKPYEAVALAAYRKTWIPFAPYIAQTLITPTLGVMYQVTERVAHVFGYTSGNYGIAIILLTMLVRGLMFPLGRKQARSAQKMQSLQPLLKELQEKYKDDKEKLTKETFALYGRHGVNPVSGCLPALIQLPIFVGLWQALNTSFPLRHASFLWIRDLSAPDMLFHIPFTIPLVTFYLGEWLNLLPFGVIGLMLIQTKLFAPPATTPEAEMQQKTMKIMMIVMGVMFYKVPSGLGIYFITSSLWAIGERLLLPKVTHATVPDGDGKAALSQKGLSSPGGDSSNGSRGASKQDPERNGDKEKPQGPFAKFWTRILEEARKDPTYRNVAEGREGDKNREKDQGRERERDRPRPKPRRR
jgi:YidC/Oxa1 family membrane protein insertase